MVGVGLPSAWQLNVNGSFFGTVVSMGCSMMRGFSPGMKEEEAFINIVSFIPCQGDGCVHGNPTLSRPLECVLDFQRITCGGIISGDFPFPKRNSSLTAKQVLSLNAAAIKRPLSRRSRGPLGPKIQPEIMLSSNEISLEATAPLKFN